jgi:hypothetical protein
VSVDPAAIIACTTESIRREILPAKATANPKESATAAATPINK